MRVMKEFIEEGRRGQLARTRQLTVPGHLPRPHVSMAM
jgi:hypothetical protein